MNSKLKLLLGSIALSCGISANAGVASARISGYLMIILDSDNKENTICQRLQYKTDSSQMPIEEDWASISQVTDVVVPAQLNVTTEGYAGTYYISSLATHAFQYAYNPRDVNDPVRYEFINSVKTVTLPTTLTTIGDEVFQGCGSLTTVNIPSSVTSMGLGTFDGCASLTSINFNPSLSNGILPNNTFRDCSSLTEITLPESVTMIGAEAFKNCTSLTKITFKAENLDMVASDAFDGIDMSQITISVPAGCAENFSTLTAMGATVVSEAVEVKLNQMFTIDGIVYRVTSVDPKELSVRSCPNKYLEGAVTIPQTISYKGNVFNVTSIDGYAFDKCTLITRITLPEGLRQIDESAFANCESVTSVNLPSSLQAIGTAAFENTQLTSLTIPENVTTLGAGAFSGMGSLEEITINGQVTDLQTLMFRNCTNLKKVTFPASLETIGDGAFTNCPALEEIAFHGTSILLSGNALSNATFNGTGWDYTPIDLTGVAIEIPNADCLDGFESLIDLVKCVKTPDGTIIYGEGLQEGELRYFEGDAVTEINGITSGTYFLRVHAAANENDPNFSRGEAMLFANNNDRGAFIYTDYSVGGEGTTNSALVWNLEVSQLTRDGKTFTVFSIQNASTEYYWSIDGSTKGVSSTVDGVTYPARGDVMRTKDESKIALLSLVELPSDYVYTGNYTDTKRFFMQLQNAQFGNSNNKVVAYPFVHNNSGTPIRASYWANASVNSTAMQFELIPAIARSVAETTVTVKLPSFNGKPIADQTIETCTGYNIESQIREIIANFGGMDNATITGEDGTLIVSKNNKVFTVSGRWDREMVANHIYRICLKPNDQPAAMRYDALDGKIRTTVDSDQETFNRVEPERLWFFSPVEGKPGVYTLHTMAAPDKGIYIEDCHDSNDHVARATLSDETNAPTEFTIGESTWSEALMGDIYMLYGTNNRNALNDRDHYLANWTNAGAAKSDAGSAMRLYPILDEDLATLGVAPETEPTVENLKEAIDNFNKVNVAAALRRIGYFGPGLIGPYVGQYNNAKGNAHEMYQKALTLPNDASDEEKAEIVAALDVTKLQQLELLPNRYYRFKNKVSGLYISSISSNTIGTRAYMDLTGDNTRSNTVFYYDQDGDENTLVCFDNGQVLPSFNGTNWIPVLKTDADAAKGTKFTAQNDGTFLIHISGNDDSHRHLYGGADTQNHAKIVDCAGNQTGDKYHWYIELVRELPITLYNVTGIVGYGDEGWTSVYSPVALQIPAESGLTAFEGTFDGQYVEPTKAGEDAIIPANQSTILYYNGEGTAENSEMAGREHISYVNLPLLYDYAGNDQQPEGNLPAGIYAFEKEEGMTYFTLHESHSNNFREYTDSYIPGFKAHLVVETSAAGAYYPITLNPDLLTPQEDAVIVEKNEEGSYNVTITLGRDNCELYYKHDAAEVSRRRIVDHSGYNKSENVEENVHTITVPAGELTYYAYHPETGSKGTVRTVTIDDNATTGLFGVTTDASGRTVIFDLKGRRLSAPAKGIVIINGHKAYIK